MIQKDEREQTVGLFAAAIGRQDNVQNKIVYTIYSVVEVYTKTSLKP